MCGVCFKIAVRAGAEATCSGAALTLDSGQCSLDAYSGIKSYKKSVLTEKIKWKDIVSFNIRLALMKEVTQALKLSVRSFGAIGGGKIIYEDCEKNNKGA